MPGMTELFADLVRLEVELWEVVDHRLRAELALPAADFLPLRVVAQTDPCRVGDVARSLSISVGGASKCVDRLVGRGWCARRVDPDDRRSSLVELTETGRRGLEAAVAAVEAELARTLGHLPDSDRPRPGPFLDALAVVRSDRSRDRS